MSVWEIFKTAVWRAHDERVQEHRRTRALERIAVALENHNVLTEEMGYGPPFPTVTPPPERK